MINENEQTLLGTEWDVNYSATKLFCLDFRISRIFAASNGAKNKCELFKIPLQDFALDNPHCGIRCFLWCFERVVFPAFDFNQS
jgi:hypothetical protein